MSRLTPYQKRMVKKDKNPYKIARKIFIGDFGTYIEDTGSGTYDIVSRNSKISVDSNGNINISGNTKFMNTEPLGFQHRKDISYLDDTSKDLWKNEKYNISSAIGYVTVKVGKREGIMPIFSKEKIDDNIIVSPNPKKV